MTEFVTGAREAGLTLELIRQADELRDDGDELRLRFGDDFVRVRRRLVDFSVVIDVDLYRGDDVRVPWVHDLEATSSVVGWWLDVRDAIFYRNSLKREELSDYASAFFDAINQKELEREGGK